MLLMDGEVIGFFRTLQTALGRSRVYNLYATKRGGIAARRKAKVIYEQMGEETKIVHDEED